MNKIIALVIIVLLSFYIVGCEDDNPFKCNCINCDEAGCNCSSSCQMNPDGTCNCPDCPGKANTQSPSEQITITSRERENHSTNVNVVTQIPSFNNLADVSKREIINNKIINSINPYIEEINMVSENSTEVLSKDNLMDTKMYEYYVTYDRYNNGNYVSLLVNQNIKIAVAGNEAGGLRSNKWIDTYNVDATTSDEIYLKDICKNISNYKSVIMDEVNKQAKSKNIELNDGKGLLEILDTQKFYIKDNKLVIYFEPAAVAPFLLGDLTFEMPFTMLENGQFVK